jgi:hypothetical protein
VENGSSSKKSQRPSTSLRALSRESSEDAEWRVADAEITKALAETERAAPDDLNDALATLLENGSDVVVGFVDEAKRDLFHRAVWIVRFRIEEGEHAGRLVSWWLRALDPDPKRRVSRGSSIATSYVAATGLRPPRDLARRRPSYWLSGAEFRVRTRVVGRDVHGVERPLTASYSVVAAILERVAGAPPALRERR